MAPKASMAAISIEMATGRLVTNARTLVVRSLSKGAR